MFAPVMASSTSAIFAISEYMEEVAQEVEAIQQEAEELVFSCSSKLWESELVDGLPVHVWELFHADEIYS